MVTHTLKGASPRFYLQAKGFGEGVKYWNLHLYGIYEEVSFISIIRQFHHSSPRLISLYFIIKICQFTSKRLHHKRAESYQYSEECQKKNI